MDRAKFSQEIGHNSERVTKNNKERRTQAGTAVCKTCSAINMRKHWFLNPQSYEKVIRDPLTRFVECPGCSRLAEKHIEGEVLLESPLLEAEKEMVYGTVYNAAARAFHENPLSRIYSIEDRGSQMRILTTTCTLAGRIGRVIKRAMKGNLEIKPSPGEKFVSVHWTGVALKE